MLEQERANSSPVHVIGDRQRELGRRAFRADFIGADANKVTSQQCE